MKTFHKLNYLLLTLIVLAVSCKKENPPPAPTGDFTFSPANPTYTDTCQF